MANFLSTFKEPGIKAKGVHSPRVESIQALRGIAVLLVLFYHIGVYEGKVSKTVLLGAMTDMGKAGVDVFFVISGFVMLTISSNPGRGDDKASSFLLKRAVRIYPLYWFYTAIALLIFAVRPDLANRSGGIGEVDILRSILLIPDIGGAPIVGQGWTLIHEMYFYLIYGLILLGGRRFRGPLLLAWGTVVASASYLWNPNWNCLSPSIRVCLELVFSPLTLEFLGGCFVAHLTSHNCNRMGRTSFFSGAFLLLFGGIPMSYVGLEWNREFSAGIPAILLVYGAIAMERSSGFRAPRLLHTVGDASYSIYLSHILCLSACLHVWRLFIADGLLDNLIIVILMISVSLISGYASYRYVEVPLQNLFRGLFVQRHPPPVAPKLDSLG